MGTIVEQIRLDVSEDGIFAEIVANDGRDVGVESLVVRDAGSDGVGQDDVAGTVGVEEAWDTEIRVATEAERIEEVVVNTAIDDVDALQARRGAHVDDVVVDEQVASFDQFDAHLLGEKGVLEIGGVEDTRREQNDFGLVAGRCVWRSERTQCREQRLRIVIDRGDSVVAKERWENFLQDLAVGQHVRNATGNSKIVFEDGKASVGKANQIGSTDADIDSMRDGESAHLPAEVAAAINKLARDDAVGEDPSPMIDVFEEKVESGDALGESAFDLPPFVERDDARQKIVGEDALSSLVVAVNSKSDALMEKRQVSGLLAFAEFFRRKFQQTLEQGFIVSPRRTRGGEHLIVGRIELVVSKRRTKQTERRVGWVHPAHKSASSGTARLHP